MYQRYNNKRKGFAAVYSALIIASIVTTFAFVISTKGIHSLRLIRLAENRLIAHDARIACQEYVLMEVRRDPETSFSGTADFGNVVCTYTVAGSIPTKTIALTLSSDTSQKDVLITITQIYPTIEIE